MAVVVVVAIIAVVVVVFVVDGESVSATHMQTDETRRRFVPDHIHRNYLRAVIPHREALFVCRRLRFNINKIKTTISFFDCGLTMLINQWLNECTNILKIVFVAPPCHTLVAC